MRTETNDDLRTGLHGMWSSVAPAWEQHAAYVDERSAETTERLLELTRPLGEDLVLELACGPGSVGLAAAFLVPDGQVVLSDVAPEMTMIAARRAARRGLENVGTRVLDLEAIDEPDDRYDVVVCREGLMLVPDPGRAACEIARVLAPGGRAAVAVWGDRERNPWLGVLFDAVTARIGAPVPPPGLPGPFSLTDPDQLAGHLTAAGLSDVVVEELPVPLRAGSFDEWWSTVTALAGPLAQMLAALDTDVVAPIRAHAAEALRAYETADGLDIPGVTLIASGNKA